MWLWTKPLRVSAAHTDQVFVGSLLTLLATGFLARDKLSAVMQFKLCPRWMRTAAILFVVYAVVGSFSTAFLHYQPDDPDGIFTISFILLPLSALSSCLLYSVRYKQALSDCPLIERSRNSFIGVCFFVVYLVIRHAGYLQPLERQQVR